MSIIKNFLGYFLFITFIFLSSLFLPYWSVGYYVPILLIACSMLALIYVVISFLISILKANKKFHYGYFLLPVTPLLLSYTLFYFQSKDLLSIENQMDIAIEALEACGEVENCYLPMKSIRYRGDAIEVNFTKGITTENVRFSFRRNCLNIFSSGSSRLKDKYYNDCGFPK